MSLDYAVAKIVEEARALSAELPRVSWYGFGSCFHGEPPYADIDILVVCQTVTEAISIRAKSREICARWPVHLLIMTKDEEAETGFVAAQSCRPLWKLLTNLQIDVGVVWG